MHSKLIKMLNQGEYNNVLIELEQYEISEYTEELAIIAASALLAVENYEKAQQYLQLGLQINNQSDELYLLLGNYYGHFNPMQMYLCYENAELYCQNTQDKEMLQTLRKKIKEETEIKYKKVSIILLSSDSPNRTRRCIESIRKNNLSCSYEIIVVDNTSTEKWLEQQEDITFIRNSKNINQGIEAADSESDIMLLDADEVLLPNSLFWLRMGLYEDEHTGAAESQLYKQFLPENIVSINNFCEFKFYLEKPAILVRREVINEVGLLDTEFTWNKLCMQIKDFSLRLCSTGWKNISCHNSFIYYSKNEEHLDVIQKDNLGMTEKEKFRQKWSFDIVHNTDIEDRLVNLINADKDKTIHVLEVGCGLGETLAKIQFKYPNAQTYGIEFSPQKAAISSIFLNVVQGDTEKLWIPFGNIRFDYIILSDTLGYFQQPKEIIKKLSGRLKSKGAFLCSIPNFMNLSVLSSLIQGEFISKTQLNFFDLNSIRKLFDGCRVYIDKLEYIYADTDIEEQNKKFLNNISQIFENVDKKNFLAQRYVFRAQSSAKELKITAVGLIKNAADIIETYIRANSLLVDNFVLLDNMCSDRTIPILKQLQQEGFNIEIIKDEIIEHNQSEKMHKLIYYVNEKYHPDFIIPIDDDECIVPSSKEDTVEDIRYKIGQLPQNNLYYVKWKIYVPNENDDENEICVMKRQMYCCEDKEEALNKIIIPGKILEDRTFSIVPGNHLGEGNLIKEHLLLPFARMAHFPCRSEAQVRSKVLTGWTNCLALPGRKPGDASQWKYMYSIAKKGERLSLHHMQQMAGLYISSIATEYVHIKEPVNLPEEAMIIKYTHPNEVNPWENYCTNVEALAQKYVELLNKKSQ